VVRFANIGGLADEFNRREAYDVFNIQLFFYRKEKLMLNIRNLILSAMLVVLLLLAIPLTTARTEVISDPSGDSASVSNQPKAAAKRNIASIPSYLPSLDERFDALREANAHHLASQTTAKSYPRPIDERFDALREANAHHRASQTTARSYPRPTDECFDVGLIYHTQCLRESPASTP
jgi:hypothetical protein